MDAEAEDFRRRLAANKITTAWRVKREEQSGSVLLAAGSLASKLEQKRNLTHRGRRAERMASLLSHVDLDESEDALPVADQLRDALASNGVKIISLFRTFDTDQDGVITADEFETGLRALGLDVPSPVIHGLYEGWDNDGSGRLTLKELAEVLNMSTIIKPCVRQDDQRPPRSTPALCLRRACLAGHARPPSRLTIWQDIGLFLPCAVCSETARSTDPFPASDCSFRCPTPDPTPQADEPRSRRAR